MTRWVLNQDANLGGAPFISLGHGLIRGLVSRTIPPLYDRAFVVAVNA
jgi:hypothetical protein